MENTAIFIDYENIRIRCGNLSCSFDAVRGDFIDKLINKINELGCNITHISAYDNFEEKFLNENEIMTKFMAKGVLPKHIISDSYKNSADIQMSLDALEVAIQDNIDTFIIVSCDKDMFPLIKKLKEKAKKVILVGITFNTSNYIIRYADEFIPVEEIIDQKYDENYLIKKDIITATKRIKNLYDWSHNNKGRDLEKDFCFSKVKATLYQSTKYTKEIFEKLSHNNIFEEYTYNYRGRKYTGIKFIDSDVSRSICNDGIPEFY